MHDADPDDPDEISSDLIDVSSIDFRHIDPSGSAMARALQRIRDEMTNPQDAVAGFQSAM